MGLSLLADKFREKMSKSKDMKMQEGQASIGYPTGFLNFDFLNGCISYGLNKQSGDRHKYYSVGISDGCMVMFIGRTACGKTTLAIQMAANIIRPYKTSCIFHDDVEGGGSNYSRRKVLTKMSDEALEDRYIFRNSGVTLENLYERIKAIHDLKIENREAFEYDTGMFDSFGNRIYKLEPSVYLLDSLAMVMPEKNLEEDELSGQMSQTAAARAIAATFRRVIPMLKTANIILMVINHIGTKIQGMVKTKSDMSYLKLDETLPGGRTPLYLANNLIRLDDTNLKASDSLGIDGKIITTTLCKTRSSQAGRTTKLVLDYDRGFDADLSMLLNMKEEGFLNGSGAFLYFGDRSDIKFSLRNFREKLEANPELKDIFDQSTMEYVQTLITEVKQEEIEQRESLDYISIIERMNNMVAA